MRALMPGSMRSGSVRSRATVTTKERRSDFCDGSRATGLSSVIVPGNSALTMLFSDLLRYWMT